MMLKKNKKILQKSDKLAYEHDRNYMSEKQLNDINKEANESIEDNKRKKMQKG